jgi:hypothetical protein
MSRFIVLGVALAMLAAGAITTAFKLNPSPGASGSCPASRSGDPSRGPTKMHGPTGDIWLVCMDI